MKNKYPWVASIAGLVIVLDQLTKYLVVQRFKLHESMPVIPGFFDLTYVRNPGAAFGILANAQGHWRVVFFITVSLAALAVIIALIRTSHDRLPIIAFALIGGGAVGNLIDRVRFGEVVDFIEWYYRSYHWPTFNIADSAITIGVALLAADMLFERKRSGATAHEPNNK